MSHDIGPEISRALERMAQAMRAMAIASQERDALVAKAEMLNAREQLTHAVIATTAAIQSFR